MIPFPAKYYVKHKVASVCEWRLGDNPDFPVWYTECGTAHEFMNGTPVDNFYVYCPYCGRRLSQIAGSGTDVYADYGKEAQMRYRIYYTIEGFDDVFIVEGETVEEARENALDELQRRGLDPERNNVWSERLEAPHDQ